VVVAFLAVALWLGLSWSVAHELTRRSKPRCFEPIPELTGVCIEELRLTTCDGEDLGAWWIEGDAQRPVILLLHGNGGARASMLPQAQWLAERRYSVLLVTLRAHGDSSGQFNDAGYSARDDVVAAAEWIAERAPHRPVVIWGQSLGGAASVFAAGELSGRVDGYIWECVYGDLRQAVWHRLQRRLPVVLDRIAYYGLMIVSPLVLPELEAISPERAAKNIPADVPVLLLAGSHDERATVAESRAIAAAVGANATVTVVDGADHLCLWDKDRQCCCREVSRLLDRLSR